MGEHQGIECYPVEAVIRSRRTIRHFKPDDVSPGLLLDLMDAACWAPNHGLREPWRFIQYRGKARSLLADAVLAVMTEEEKVKYGEQRLKDFMTIPVHLVVIMKQEQTQKRWEEDFAAACCWIHNFQLLAWEREIGMVWKTNQYMYHHAFASSIGVGPDEKIVGVLHIGVADRVHEPRARSSAASRMIVQE